MSLKSLCVLLIVFISFVTPSMASDVEWRRALNLRAHSDSYRYRYELMQRFGADESQVIGILSRVSEPSDAYMVFRVAELSGYSSEEVLRVYRERAHGGWDEIASVLGIHLDRYVLGDLYDNDTYRPVQHTTTYVYRYVPHIHKRPMPPPRHPLLQPKRYEHSHHKSAPVVQAHPKPHRHHEQPYAPKKYEAHFQGPSHPQKGPHSGEKKQYQR